MTFKENNHNFSTTVQETRKQQEQGLKFEGKLLPNCNIISNKKTFKATDTKGLKELASHVCVFRKVKRGYISSKLRNKRLIKENTWAKK